MKRIYLLLMLFVAFAGSASAQADIVLTRTMADTIKFNDPALTYYIIQYSFKNNGPNALAVTDKIVLKTFTRANPLTLNLPPASGSWPGGLPKDSTVYKNDTFGFKSAPTPNPANLCDSVWATTSTGTVIADPSILPSNRVCKAIFFKPDPAASVNTISGVENGLTIYPNPVSDMLNVKYNFRSDANATLTVTDMLGNVVYKQDLGANNYGEKSIPVNTAALSNGLYMLQLSVGETKLVSKFSVQK